MSIHEIICEIITKPTKGLSDTLSLQKPFLFSALIVLTAFFCHSVAALLWQRYSSAQAASVLILRSFAETGLFVVFGILMTSLFHFIAVWLHGEGNVINLFILIGVTLLPFIFLPAAAIFSRAIGETGLVIYKLLFLSIFIWIFCLQILSLEVIYRLPLGKAITIFIIPFLSTFIIPFILILTTIIFSIFFLLGKF